MKLKGVKVRINPNFSRKMKKATAKKTVQVAKAFIRIVKPLTPKDTGLARRSWKLKGKGVRTYIVNIQKYSEVLEGGSSKQAPKGMIEPARRILRRRFTK